MRRASRRRITGPPAPWRGLVVALVIPLLAGGCVAAEAGAGAEPDRSVPPRSAPEEDWVARTDSDAVFTVECRFSHRAPDDPIVSPGRPGASHGHEFFGSETTASDSTGPGLVGTETTCVDPDDTAAYWVPTLSVAGVPVDPTLLRAYYRAAVGTDVRDVVAPPTGLAMISGSPTGPVAAAGHDHTGHGSRTSSTGSVPTGPPAAPAGGSVDAGWSCGLRPPRLSVTPPDDCVAGSPLTLHLRFPDCWDGRNLDSADHRSHVARSVDGACPASHPVLMTQIQVSVWWPIFGSDANRVTLSSGPVTGAHGDFLNGWDQAALTRQVDLCIHANANCTVG